VCPRLGFPNGNFALVGQFLPDCSVSPLARVRHSKMDLVQNVLNADSGGWEPSLRSIAYLQECQHQKSQIGTLGNNGIRKSGYAKTDRLPI